MRLSLTIWSTANNFAANASKEAHAKQKAVAQERKAAKPNADSIARSKKIWERLRRQSHVPLEERKELVTELFEIITGRVKEFVVKHDTGRVIQTALKYGNLEQRKMIAKELKGEYQGLAESRYAKFMIGKVLVHGDNETRDIVVPEFYGKVRRMIKHPEASWILDDVYRGAATPKQKARLLKEWYGAEFAIFKPGEKEESSSDLATLLAERPGKRPTVMRYLYDLINQLVQKKTTGFTMLHDAMLQYYLVVTPGGEEAAEFVELLKGDEEGDLLKNLAFTKSGARVVALALANSNAKDRKLLLKTYKNIMQSLAFDTYGHQVLLAAYDVIDDTVLTSKSIFSELIPGDAKQNPDDQHSLIMSYLTNLNGRIPILYPFVAKPASILPDEDIALLKEIHKIRTTTSKKDANVRRKELIKALSPPLLSLIAAKAGDLIQTSFGCQFITEVLLSSEGDKNEALKAVANLAGREEPDLQAAIEVPAALRMLKALALGGRYNQNTKAVDANDPPLGFADLLYSKAKAMIVGWATGTMAFVVVGLLDSADFSGKEEVLTTLRNNRSDLEKFAKDKSEAGTDGKDSKTLIDAGRKGAQLLLRMLDK